MRKMMYLSDRHIVDRRFVCYVIDLVNSWKAIEMDDYKFCKRLVHYVLRYNKKYSTAK
jgi:hypothetical protein